MSLLKYFRNSSFALVALPAIVFMTGCDEIDKMNENAGKRPVSNPAQVVDMPGNAPSTPAPSTPAPAPNNGAQTVEIVSTQPGTQPTPSQPAPAQPAPVSPNLEKMAAGQGVQGQGYGGGIITEPIHQYFMARDQIKIGQLQHQLDIWKALHNNKPPKNKDEYMKEIVEACNVELPELPAGRRYVYDAKKGELLVESGGPAQ